MAEVLHAKAPAQRLEMVETFCLFAAMEDVVIKKSDFHQHGESGKHWHNLTGTGKVMADRVGRTGTAGLVGRPGLAPAWQIAQDLQNRAAGLSCYTDQWTFSTHGGVDRDTI